MKMKKNRKKKHVMVWKMRHEEEVDVHQFVVMFWL